jgi:UDP-N-acetylglucosamine--N-acetylmuramyl-(pentapeptide) pyrophosphoryl-undecaprenol N-acetylglucosamine transferase
MKVVIAGGGTAGHVNPALALAGALGGEDVTFVGTSTGAEATLVPAAGFELRAIDVGGFDRARPLSIVPTGVRAAGAVVSARRVLRGARADVVVGMGGYVSLPVCLAAASRRTPVVLHEQNIVLGLSNRVCRRWARTVAVSFEETLREVGRKGVLVGNPVSEELSSADFDLERDRGIGHFELDPGRKTLLVFGGSQGAQRVNEAASGLASTWRDRRDVQVLHITGRMTHSAIAQRVDSELSGSALLYRMAPFAERMVEAYAVADLALCRGGATTVAEICVAGIPAIIVPYPFHRDRQQELHGRVLEKAGAGVVVLDSDATTSRLAKTADELIADESVLQRMSKAALALARPDASSHLARVVREAA